jgi:molybdopterin/thiamine biosynthesis adenylyltransferase
MLYEEKFYRNKPTLNDKSQEKLRSSHICLIGLGGTGGFILENLVRLGAQNFILFDHDRFELTNFNRQLLATDTSLDKQKVDAAAHRIRSINNKVKIKKYSRFDPKKIKSPDIVIDATDNIKSKLEIAISCRKNNIPYLFCSAQDSRGIVSVFTKYRFEKAFAVDKSKLESRSCESVLCPAVSLIGSLASTQALNYIIGKPVVRAPRAIFIDLFDKRLFWLGELG